MRHSLKAWSFRYRSDREAEDSRSLFRENFPQMSCIFEEIAEFYNKKHPTMLYSYDKVKKDMISDDSENRRCQILSDGDSDIFFHRHIRYLYSQGIYREDQDIRRGIRPLL